MTSRQQVEARDRRRAIGQRVRKARTALGLTQELVAERAELAEATLRAVEAGRRGPSVDSITAIAKALGVSVATFFADGAVADGSGSEAARLFRDLDERLQPVIIRFMRDLNSALPAKTQTSKSKARSKSTKAKDRA